MKKVVTGRLGIALLVGVALLLSACGAGGSGSGNGQTSASSLASTKQLVDTLFKGTFTAPPSKGPAPLPAKKIWIISYGQSYAGAALEAAAAQKAAEVLGWTATIYDAKFVPSNAVAGIEQAVAAGANGIFVPWFDCASIKAGLLAAQQAGVPVVTDEASDCPGEHLFKYIVSFHPGTFAANDGSVSGYLQGWGAALASYAIDRTNGKAKVLMFDQTDTSTFGDVVKGGVDRLAECGGCQVVDTIKFTNADIGPSLQQKAQQALLQNPEANTIFAPGDGILVGGVLAALRASGNKYGSMVIAGGEGSAVIGSLRTYPGDWAVCTLPLDWSGYQAIDALNRLFAGQQPVSDSGIGYQLVDKNHNLPPGDLAVPMKDGTPIDFATLYDHAWKR